MIKAPAPAYGENPPRKVNAVVIILQPSMHEIIRKRNGNKKGNNNKHYKIFRKQVPITLTDAPKTFLTPISFFRCSATNEVRPNNPRQEITNGKNGKKSGKLANAFFITKFFCIIIIDKLVFKRLLRIEFFKYRFNLT